METRAKITRDLSYGFSLFTSRPGDRGLVLLATFKFGLGAELKFSQAYAISMYAWLPGCIKALLVMLTIRSAGARTSPSRTARQ